MKQHPLDIGKAYDTYYSETADGKRSIYAERYGGKTNKTCHKESVESSLRIIQRREARLQQISKVSDFCSSRSNSELLQNNVLRIFDFGCGDGRFFSVIEDIAQQMAKKGIRVELVAYDISKKGLEIFSNKLQNNGFLENRSKSSDDSNWHITKGNVDVHFFHGNMSYTPEQLANEVGNVDMTICMFGTLSHIPGRENRVNWMKMFNAITDKDGEVVISVPSTRRFKEEQSCYKMLLSQDFNELGGIKLEQGDLFYTRQGEGGNAVRNFYHVYSAQELREDLESSNLLSSGIKTDHILDETQVTGSQFLRELDTVTSRISTAIMGNYLADYFIVSSPPNKKVSAREGAMCVGFSPMGLATRGGQTSLFDEPQKAGQEKV